MAYSAAAANSQCNGVAAACRGLAYDRRTHAGTGVRIFLKRSLTPIPDGRIFELVVPITLAERRTVLVTSASRSRS